MKLGYSRANLIGVCKHKGCREPATGTVNTDDDTFILKCINCGREQTFRTEYLKPIKLRRHKKGTLSAEGR